MISSTAASNFVEVFVRLYGLFATARAARERRVVTGAAVEGRMPDLGASDETSHKGETVCASGMAETGRSASAGIAMDCVVLGTWLSRSRYPFSLNPSSSPSPSPVLVPKKAGRGIDKD